MNVLYVYCIQHSVYLPFSWCEQSQIFPAFWDCRKVIVQQNSAVQALTNQFKVGFSLECEKETLNKMSYIVSCAVKETAVEVDVIRLGFHRRQTEA